MKLNQLVKYLNDYLNVADCDDVSQNGLQVESGKEVKKIAIAVDACMETFQEAKRLKADVLIVHHGLFWKKSLLITGVHRDRIAFLLENGISLYAVHLPLDIHAELGNNAQLAKLLNMEIKKPFGRGVGYQASLVKAMDRDKFVEKVMKVLDSSDYRFLDFGVKKIRNVAILSGSGSSFIAEAVAKNVDMLITGEGGHVSYHQAKEDKMNVLYAGHYATETLGVKAVAEHIEDKFNIPYEFIHVPTKF